MGFTSAAEAKLDARIRPDITAMRSRTPYPKRRLSVVPQPGTGESAPSSAAVPDPAQTGAGHDDGLEAIASAAGVLSADRSAESAQTAGVSQLADAARRARAQRQAARTPIRLTRRGRIAVGVLVFVTVIAAAALLWLVLANRAQASSGGAGHQGSSHALVRVVVRPGQTLWSIASKADPYADPRAVIQEIIDENELSGTSIHPGQVILVPRG
jgi:LysM repeat protein